MGNFDKREWKSKIFDGLVPTEVEWGMMAAYIDGEGSILINPRRGKEGGRYTDEAATFYLKVTVANTDVRLMHWLKRIFGGTFKDANTAKYYEGRNVKTAWHWSCSSNRAVWILHNCFPLFVIKREQAEIGIRLQESMNRGHRGRALPKEIVEERRSLKSTLLVLKQRGKITDKETKVAVA